MKARSISANLPFPVIFSQAVKALYDYGIVCIRGEEENVKIAVDVVDNLSRSITHVYYGPIEIGESKGKCYIETTCIRSKGEELPRVFRKTRDLVINPWKVSYQTLTIREIDYTQYLYRVMRMLDEKPNICNLVGYHNTIHPLCKLVSMVTAMREDVRISETEIGHRSGYKGGKKVYSSGLKVDLSKIK